MSKKDKDRESILKSVWEFSRENFTDLVLVAVPIFMVAELVSSSLMGFVPVDDVAGNLIGSFLIGGLLKDLISLVGVLTIIYLVYDRVNGRKLGVNDAFKKAQNVFGNAVYTMLILNTLLFIGYLLLMIPGIVYGNYWVFTLVAVAVKGEKGRGALSASKKLVDGRWLNVFGTLLILGLIVQAPLLMVTLPARLNGLQEYGELISMMSNSFYELFFTVVVTVYYIYLAKTDSKKWVAW